MESRSRSDSAETMAAQPAAYNMATLNSDDFAPDNTYRERRRIG
jgi:hypothetical protein